MCEYGDMSTARRYLHVAPEGNGSRTHWPGPVRLIRSVQYSTVPVSTAHTEDGVTRRGVERGEAPVEHGSHLDADAAWFHAFRHVSVMTVPAFQKRPSAPTHCRFPNRIAWPPGLGTLHVFIGHHGGGSKFPVEGEVDVLESLIVARCRCHGHLPPSTRISPEAVVVWG